MASATNQSIWVSSQSNRVVVKPIAQRVRKSLAEKVEQRRIPVKRLAHDAGCTERTVRNFFNGKAVRDDTIKNICAAANVDFEIEIKNRGGVTKSSDLQHGAYSKELVQSYIGCFFAYRRSFSLPQTFIRSLYSFEWDVERCCLRFKESQNYQSSRLRRRVSYDQEGDVFISNSIGLVHLLTKKAGALRLITLTRLHPDENVMRGAVLTQAEWPDHYQPGVSPIYFRKITQKIDISELSRSVGPIEARDPDYDEIASSLAYIEKEVVNFIK